MFAVGMVRCAVTARIARGIFCDGRSDDIRCAAGRGADGAAETVSKGFDRKIGTAYLTGSEYRR
jgi:hypothetical protein